MKKIIYIANVRIPTEKAHGFQICKTCEKFSDLGTNTELWFPTRKNIIKDSLFDYYGIKENFVVKKIKCIDLIFLSKYIGFLAFYIQTLFFALKIFFKKIPKDTIVYSRDFLIIALLNFRGLETVYNAHNWSNKRGVFLKLFLNKKTKIVCNSEGTKSEFYKRGFKNCIVVPNGVDLDKFEEITDNKEELRKKINLPIDKKIVLYLGHLYLWKGSDIIMELVGKNRNSNILFVVVGGTQKDLEKYKKIKKDKNLNNLFFTGHQQQKNTPYYLKSADILLLPNIAISEESIKYTSPIKMFEYMASGNPIIASDLSSMREVLNEDNSILVEAGNSDSFNNAIKKVLDDPNFSKKIGEKALFDVKNYTWDEYIKKILNFIKL